MFETELKFQVPPAQRDALRRAVATATARTTRLQALYVDTADRRLAAAGLALRLRKEGRYWVQTLKGRGDGLMQRLEHEVRLPSGPGTPQLDAERHAASPVGQQLRALLTDGTALQPVYRTDIHRLHRQVRHAGALVELAYDRGWIHAGERQLEVDEIEFELLRGPGLACVDLAMRWAGRFGLWWDVRTKSERGYRLALGLDQVPATRSAAVELPAGTSPRQALALWVRGALQQALPNAAEMASGTAQPEHLHQLRTALRRLRSLLRVYAPLAEDPPAALALEDDWRGPFGQLGAARDVDVLRQTLLPLIEQAQQAASAPALPPLPRAEGPPPQEVVRSAVFTALMLRTLALCMPASEPSHKAATGPADLAQIARAQIKPLWRQVLRGAKTFSDADPQTRHRLRKRLKRLRLALSAVQPLLKPKPTATLQRGLGKALARLGELNDLEVAEQRFREAAQQDPAAWFAVGYLSACRQQALKPASRALERLGKARIAWRDGSDPRA